MSEATTLRQALLDLGLEDLIPLPEAATAEEVRPFLAPGTLQDLAAALIELLRERRIQVWSGPWPEEPEIVHSVTAEQLLHVEEQYSFNSPADLRRRVYYVNVDSLRVPEPDQPGAS